MKKTKLKDLIPDNANFNKGTEFGNSLIEKSLTKFGAGRSILIDKNNRIIAGNKTVENAAAIGLEDMIVVETTGDRIVAVKRTDVDLDSDQGREMALADNATAKANIDWDAEILADFDLPLDDWGIDLKGFGDEAGSSDAEPQIDKAAELNKKWKVKSGDLWLIGSHRLLCGDSTVAQDVEKVLGGGKPNLMITDPPYGVEYNADWRNHSFRADGSPTDGRAICKVTNDDNCRWLEVYNLFPGNVVYIWCASLRSTLVHADIVEAGFVPNYLIIWNKSSLVIGRGDYHWKHEPCWYATRKGSKHYWIGDRSQTTVWDIDKPQKSETGHSTQKPLECMAKPIRNHEGDVYEPFAGSGTTLVACENLNRKCYAIEISPDYCAVILERMRTAFLGIEIKRAETAKTARNRQ